MDLKQVDIKSPTDTASSHHEVHVGHIIDPAKERQLLRKLDIHICPLITLIFLVAYLDRSNIGNAAVAGMPEEIHLVGNQLGNGVSLFYATYVFFEIPFTLMLKKLRPNRLISALNIGFSASVISAGFVENVAGLYVTRLLLGVFESALFPCLAMVLTTFYKREEQAQRISSLSVAIALSGGFGGILAFGLMHLDGAAGLSGWRWLFIVEGLMSGVVGIATFFLLPNNYETAYFLNDEEKELMQLRMQTSPHYADTEEFNIREVYKTLRDPKTWLSSFVQICINICSFGFSNFLPTILKAFGYGSMTTQLLTVPVYLWAAAFYLVIAHLSDRVCMRAAFLVPLCLVTAVGYALLLGIDLDSRGVLYFATYVCVTGIYSGTGLGASWMANSHAGYYKRSMAIGLQQSIANCAGLISGQIYSSQIHGRYVLGHSVCLGAIVAALIGNCSLYVLLRYHNRKRDDLSTEEREAIIASGSYEKRGRDFHPDFRYIL